MQADRQNFESAQKVILQKRIGQRISEVMALSGPDLTDLALKNELNRNAGPGALNLGIGGGADG